VVVVDDQHGRRLLSHRSGLRTVGSWSACSV
jgi:hypothetical protein